MYSQCSVPFAPSHCLESAGPGTAKHSSGSAAPVAPKNFARSLIELLNQIRAQPYVAIEEVQRRRQYFKGNIAYYPGRTIGIAFNEGQSALDACVSRLSAHRSAPAFQFEEGVCQAAGLLAADLAASKARSSHADSRGRELTDRLKQFGTWGANCSEVIAYVAATGSSGGGGGKQLAPWDVLFSLMVDDGLPARPHYSNLMGAKGGCVGVAAAPLLAGHPQSASADFVVVIAFCTFFKGKGSEAFGGGATGAGGARSQFPVFSMQRSGCGWGVYHGPGSRGRVIRRDPTFESAVLQCLNNMRTNPAGCARMLTARLEWLGPDGRTFWFPDAKRGLSTFEGARAVREAAAVMQSTRPLPTFTRDVYLDAAAADHAADQSVNGGEGHHGSDGLMAHHRVGRYALVYGCTGEVIAYGPTSAEDVVAQLLIDDNVADRGHRVLLLKGAMVRCGIGTATHPNHGTVVVITLSEQPASKVKPEGHALPKPVWPTVTASGGGGGGGGGGSASPRAPAAAPAPAPAPYQQQQHQFRQQPPPQPQSFGVSPSTPIAQQNPFVALVGGGGGYGVSGGGGGGGPYGGGGGGGGGARQRSATSGLGGAGSGLVEWGAVGVGTSTPTPSPPLAPSRGNAQGSPYTQPPPSQSQPRQSPNPAANASGTPLYSRAPFPSSKSGPSSVASPTGAAAARQLNPYSSYAAPNSARGGGGGGGSGGASARDALSSGGGPHRQHTVHPPSTSGGLAAAAAAAGAYARGGGGTVAPSGGGDVGFIPSRPRGAVSGGGGRRAPLSSVPPMR